MQKIDIVILSDAKTEALHQLTLNCLQSLEDSVGSEYFNITVVESQPHIDYSDIRTLHINEAFSYNGHSNKAIALGESEWVGVFNNDLVFDKDWYVELMKYKYDSMSPKCYITRTQATFGAVTKGYRTAQELSGWAIVMRRAVWNEIGGLDEAVSFWCSDDAYREQLINAKIDHYLIPTSKVNHLGGGSNTLKTVDKQTNQKMTMDQVDIYNKKYNKHMFGR